MSKIEQYLELAQCVLVISEDKTFSANNLHSISVSTVTGRLHCVVK